ncbi:hypothetical protein SDC9_197707 [bioreactor metagenome]|uniref:Uncharacterized protein n=1 Tax=bioreactor metagenome TaxID=1076179 RepID=A0A645IFI3_9ZZZZ
MIGMYIHRKPHFIAFAGDFTKSDFRNATCRTKFTCMIYRCKIKPWDCGIVNDFWSRIRKFQSELGFHSFRFCFCLLHKCFNILIVRKIATTIGFIFPENSSSGTYTVVANHFIILNPVSKLFNFVNCLKRQI